MAGLKCAYERLKSTSTADDVILQIRLPDNQRGLLHAIELMPEGAVTAVAPLAFAWEKQEEGTGGNDDSADAEKLPPIGSEGIQSVLIDTWATTEPEPANCDPKYTFSLHPQGARTWKPPTGPVLMMGGENWGLRILDSTTTPVRVRIYWEE